MGKRKATNGNASGPNLGCEDLDEYRAVGVFWVLTEARWSYLLKSAKQATIQRSR